MGAASWASMDKAALPPDLAEVVEPLREADEYRRLQLARQRGVYNILTGLPGLLFLLWVGPKPSLGFPLNFLLPLALFVVFVLSCYTPKLLLPWVRRRRPDWEAAFLDAPLVKQALEKQFWFQAGFGMIGLFVLPFFVLFLFFMPTFGNALNWMALTLGILQLVAMAVLALQARRVGDRFIERGYWILAPLAILVYLLGRVNAFVTLGGSPDPVLQPALLFVSYGIFFWSLVTPPILAGLFRLLAPRRWLVR